MATPKPPPGHFTLLYFAAASSYTRKSSETFAAPMNTQDLFGFLEQKYPGMKAKVLDSCALTLNREYVDLEEPAKASTVSGEEHQPSRGQVIQAGDEVAIIPPVSSG
jgi:molybdopterin synthase sulfur carrier subunit